MQNRPITIVLAAAVVAALAACGSDSTSPPASKIVNFSATLTSAAEPSVTGNPTGTGTLTATLDTSTNVFTWKVDFSGLTSNVNNGHIHGPFPDGAKTSAGVLLNFSPSATLPNNVFTGLGTSNSGSATGSVTLGSSLVGAISGDSLKKLLLAGLTYVNIHTVTNPGGEIRAQIVPTK
jgi:hypothetical protein